MNKIDKAYIGFQMLLCITICVALIINYIHYRNNMKKINEKYNLIFQEK